MSMAVEYTEDQKWWMVDGTDGVHYWEEHGFTDAEAGAEYPGTPFEVECVMGVGVRLGWSVFLEHSSWEVFESRAEAERYVRRVHGRDPKTAELLDAA